MTSESKPYTYLPGSIRNYCINNSRIIKSVSKSKFLSKDAIGKTPKDLGYDFERVIND